MTGGKVYLTYKRRLPSTKAGITHENQQAKPMFKHILNGDKVACSCKTENASALQQNRKSSRMDALKHAEESDLKLGAVSCKSPALESTIEGTSRKEEAAPSADSQFEKKSNQVQVSSYPVSAIGSQEKLIAQVLETNSGNSLDVICPNPSIERSCISSSDAGSCLNKLHNSEGTDVLFKNKSMECLGNCLGQTVDGSDVKQKTFSCKLPSLGSPAEGTSEKEEASSYIDSSFIDKSSETKVSSCSVPNIGSHGKLMSQSTETNLGNSLNVISLKSSIEKSSALASYSDSCSNKVPNLEGPDSLAENKSTDSAGNYIGKTKLSTPLITFSRRCKRRKINNEDDTRSSYTEENDCPSSTRSCQTAGVAVPLKVCLGNTKTNVELPQDNTNSGPMFHQNQDKMKDDGSAHMGIGSGLENKTLTCDEELPHDSESPSKRSSPIKGREHLSTVARDTIRAPLNDGIQISVTVKDAATNQCIPIVVDVELENTKTRDSSEFLPTRGGQATTVPDCTKEGTQLCVGPSPSSDLNCQKETACVTSELHQSLTNSTSHWSKTGLLDLQKRVEEFSSIHSTRVHSDASTSVEEAGVCSKDNAEACVGSSTDDASEKKCLQFGGKELI